MVRGGSEMSDSAPSTESQLSNKKGATSEGLRALEMRPTLGAVPLCSR
jgi:hypothetical protein